MPAPRIPLAPWLNLFGILAAIVVVTYLLRGLGLLGFVPGLVLLALLLLMVAAGVLALLGVGRRSW